MAIAPKHGHQAFSHRDFHQRVMASAGRRRLGRRGAPEAEEDQKIRIVSSEDTYSGEKLSEDTHGGENSSEENNTVEKSWCKRVPKAVDEKIGEQRLIRSFEYAKH